MTAVDSELLVASRDGIGYLTLNRPERLNAVTLAMRPRLVEQIVAFEQDPAIRVLVLAGAGDRAFCAGMDLNEAPDPMQTPDAAYYTPMGGVYRNFYETLLECHLPTIALVHAVNPYGEDMGVRRCASG